MTQRWHVYTQTKKFFLGKKNHWKTQTANTSCWISWLSWVCKSLSFFLSTARAENMMFSGFSEPQDSALKKYLFGCPSPSNGASSVNDWIISLFHRSSRHKLLNTYLMLKNHLSLQAIICICHIALRVKHISIFFHSLCTYGHPPLALNIHFWAYK